MTGIINSGVTDSKLLLKVFEKYSDREYLDLDFMGAGLAQAKRPFEKQDLVVLAERMVEEQILYKSQIGDKDVYSTSPIGPTGMAFHASTTLRGVGR